MPSDKSPEQQAEFEIKKEQAKARLLEDARLEDLDSRFRQSMSTNMFKIDSATTEAELAIPTKKVRTL